MITIAAAGDSVMWGQGLAESDKFTNLFARELPGAQRTLVGNESHSGAKVGDLPSGESTYQWIDLKRRGWEEHPLSDRPTQSTWGEIPSGTATISEQLEELRDKVDSVDMLLLNGGPNDIGFIGALQLDMAKYNSFVKRTRDTLEDRIPQVLEQARTLFPEATIFYLGYYAGLSTTSKPGSGLNTLGAILLSLAHFYIDMTPSLRAILAGNYHALMAIAKGLRSIDQFKRQVDQFHHETLRAQAKAVALFNETTEEDGVLFINPGFKRHNAMYGTQTFVHEYDSGFDRSIALARLRYFHHLDANRFKDFSDFDDAVDSIGSLPDINDLGDNEIDVWKVANAHAAHPNRAGARRYADKLVSVGRDCVDFSLRAALLDHGLSRNNVVLSKLRMGYSLPRGSVRGLLNMTQLSSVEVQIIPTGGQRSPGYLSVRINIGDGWKHMDSLFMGPPVQVAQGFEGVMDFHGDSKLSRLKRIWVSFREKMDMRSFSARILVRINGHLAVDDTFTYRPGRRHTRLTQGRVSLIYLAKNIL